jgi:hypothetical protein
MNAKALEFRPFEILSLGDTMLARALKATRRGLLDWKRLPHAPRLSWQFFMRPTSRMESSGNLDNYLVATGWTRSFVSKKPVAADGQPIPWFTYPFIDFLEPRIKPDLQVFEYGAGYSTLWWSTRVAGVIACEHDPIWAERVKSRAAGSVKVISQPDREQYVSAVSRFPCTFDIIVIDGKHRTECAQHAFGALNDQGVIIWDNSDRTRYFNAFEICEKRGFRRLDFWGLGPINAYGWCTSVFYRPENCLKI